MFYPSDQPPISQQMTMTYISNEELNRIKQQNAELLAALRELMYAHTDKGERMAKEAIAKAGGEV